MVTTPTLWKSLTQINTSDSGTSQSDGQVVGIVTGGYVVVWTDASHVYNPVGSAIVAQRYGLLGAPAGGEVKISQFFDGDQASPAVAALANGDIAVAFTDSFGAGDIYVRRYSATLAAVATVNVDISAARTVEPAITAFADGSYAVAYTLGPVGDTDVVGRIVSAAGVVGAQFNIFDGANANFSELATLSNGNFVAVFQHDGAGGAGNQNITFGLFTSTGSFRGSSSVQGALDPDNETEPDLAALKGGGFVVVWTDAAGDGSGSGIRATLHTNAGDLLGTDFRVNSTTAGNQNEASVTALADGGFVVTWEDDNANLVRAQRFDASGNRVGSEFTVKSGTANDSPEVGLLQDGRLAFGVGDTSTGDNDVMTSIWDPRTSPINGTSGNDRMASRLEGATLNGLGGLDVLVGLDGPDVINGGPGGDTLVGGGGDDRFVYAPGWGSDIANDLAEGTGTPDFVDLTAFSNVSSLGAVLARAVDEGPDVLIAFGGVDVLYLLDAHRADLSAGDFLFRRLNDFGGNSLSDILWRRTDGTINVYSMNGSDVLGGDNISVQPGSAWQIQEKADFNGDGKADILLRHTDGTLNVYTMDGATVLGGSNLSTQPGAAWQVKGTGDFNADGKDDILLRHTDGSLNIYLMDGATVLGGSNISVEPGASWQVNGVADFNGDGRSDILLRSSDGTLNVFLMNGTTVLGGSNLSTQPGSAWQVQDVNDFGGDGKADILLRSGDGTANVYLMNGATVVGGSNLTVQPGSAWSVRDTADYNGDGRADILWRHTDGTANIYTLDGATVLGGSNISVQPGSDWLVA